MRQTLISWAITSSFLILAVAALRAGLGRRMDAGLRYALWGLVLLRLLVPVQLFSSPILGITIGSDVVTIRDTTIVQEALDAAGGQDGPQAAATVTGPPVLPSPPDFPEAPDAPDWRVIPAVLGWLWLAGSGVMAAVLLGCNLRFYLRLRRVRQPLTADEMPLLAAQLPVYEAEGLPSPCLFGVFRPAIYVAPGTDSGTLRHILAHEGTHYRHGDHIWGLLRCGALCVHWWNPLVWLAAKLSRRDGELACDEGALNRLGDGERAAYGRTLLTLVAAKAAPGELLTCSTAMAGDKRSLKERFARIARAPKRAAGIVAVAVVLAALVTVCAFGQKTAEAGSWKELKADLSLSMEGDGVRITGTVDGLELPRGAFWYPNSLLSGAPEGELAAVYPPFTDGIEGQLSAWWADEDRRAVDLSTRMTAALSSYFPSSYWDFTVDFSSGRAKVTRMEAVAGEDPDGREVRMYPGTISDEEAIRAGRIAARLLTEAEAYWAENGGTPAGTEAFPVEIAFTPISSVPQDVLDEAKALAAEQFRAVAPDGWVRTWGSARDEETGEDVPIPLPEPIEFDRVRLKSLDGPFPEAVQLDGRELEAELWLVTYEFHAVEPEQAKLLLAGGMTLDKEGWMNFCGPNYLAFTGEGDSRTATAFRSNSPSHAPLFHDELVRALEQAGVGAAPVDPDAAARAAEQAGLGQGQITVSIDAASPARAALKAALLGEAGFTYFDEEGWSMGVDITTAPHKAFDISEEYGAIWAFALVDLDGDGAEEAVLHVGDVAGDMGGYLVLRRAGVGDLRCYSSYWRTFWNLKTDGSFDYEYYTGRSGAARVSFPTSGDTMEQQSILEAYYPHIDPDAGGGSFTVDGEPATREEYDAAVAEQTAKPDAAWYEFTAENIELVLG